MYLVLSTSCVFVCVSLQFNDFNYWKVGYGFLEDNEDTDAMEDRHRMEEYEIDLDYGHLEEMVMRERDEKRMSEDNGIARNAENGGNGINQVLEVEGGNEVQSSLDTEKEEII